MSQPVTLLYVDDDLALARLVQRWLGRRGFAVEHAQSGEEALARIARGGVDVIALDHYLATGTGLDLLGQLAGIENGPAVVYVTGSADMDIAVAALKAGASDFVPKTVGEDFLELLGSAIDMAVEQGRLRSEKAAAEREVRAARDRAELLLREVNHRIANSLALVASLVSLQANALDNPVAKEALAETRARIYAISLVHKRLYSADDVGSVDLAEYLGGLLEHLENSMRGEGMGASIRASLAPLRVLTDAAVSLGVVVTELVTNAFKYAYPAGMPGQVRVELVLLDADRAELTVADDGPGWSGQGKVQGTGLGSRIVRAMCASLGAEFTYEADRGTLARLSFPIRR